MSRRVVVTGVGIVSPLGVGLRNSWEKLIAGHSGIISTSQIENAESYADIPSKVVGYVPRGSIKEGKYSAADHFDNHEQRRLPDFTKYAIVAAEEALKDANWFPTTENERVNTGVCVASSIGSLDDMYNNAVAHSAGGYRKIQPLFVPKVLTNMAAGNISIRYGFKGPNHSVSTACATGLHAIGDASRFIKDGYADVIVAGATEALIHPLALGGFARAKSLSTQFNDEPSKASRPFDKQRNGFVMGEGAGVLILEELEHALARGVDTIYGEVSGYGVTGDAYHITSPSENGEGARRAMEFAMKQANVKPIDVGYINAHATSTLLGDRAENKAINTIFAADNPNLAVTSTKGSIGHLLGAAGVVESIFTLMALKEGTIPPTLNCDEPGGHESDDDDDFKFNYVPNVAQKIAIEAALSNSFGFGGTNASICFKKYHRS